MLISKYDNYYTKVKESRKNEKDQSKVLADIKAHNKKCRLIGLALIVVSSGLMVFSGHLNPSFSGGRNSKTCSYCGRVFTDSENVDSIRKTNMCNSCYSSYKFGSEAKEAEKDYKEGN